MPLLVSPRSASPDSLSPSDLVHALAQLPGEVSLELGAEPDERARLECLSNAYTLDDRITFSDGVAGPTSWRFHGIPTDAPAWAGGHADAAGRPETIADIVEMLWPEEGTVELEVRADLDLSGQRVGIVTNHPAHYRIPLFNGLGTRIARAGGTFRVFFLGTAPDRPWLTPAESLDFGHEFVSGVRLTRVSLSSELDRRRPSHLPMGLSRRLRVYKPTLLVAGGFALPSIQSCLYGKRHGIPFGVWSGEIHSTAALRSHTRVREVQRRWLVGQADFGIAYGALAERYLRSLSPRLPVVIGRNSSVIDVSPPRKEPARASEQLEVLAVADLTVPGKGIDVIVDALSLAKDLRCRLTVIGGTPEDGALLDAAATDPRIRFLGPLPHCDVRAAYEQSDVFLFPSRVDIFGHAVVEAMSAELAVVISHVAAPLADIAVPGHNCLLADASNPHAWAHHLQLLAGDEALRRSIGKRARESVKRRWTVHHSVEGMMAGVRLGISSSPRGAR